MEKTVDCLRRIEELLENIGAIREMETVSELDDRQDCEQPKNCSSETHLPPD